MNKELYVSTTPHETKVALVEDDSLAEIYFERENEYTLAGSIYKGRVTRVLPGMQSAFVEIGLERDAFLYVSDFLDLQDEDEDGEFGEVKVSGATLARANGMVVAEPPPDEEEVSEEPREGARAAEAEGEKGEEGREAGTSRWRGRRRRRGRRGGRERSFGEQPAQAQPAEPGSEETENQGEDSGEPSSSPKPRELRGFEPRGLGVHGLARSGDADEVGPEAETEEYEGPSSSRGAPRAESQRSASHTDRIPPGTPVVLPGESISKYNRAEGQAPPAPAAAEAQEAERIHGRGRDRDRGDRDRGGRGWRGDRDRGRSREYDRGSREQERSGLQPEKLPENYTPVILPGESISKYRGSEPAGQSAVGTSPATFPATLKKDAGLADAPALASTEERGAFRDSREERNEPRSSASYSGASGLPSLTQRYAAEPEEAAVEPEVKESVEPPHEAVPDEARPPEQPLTGAPAIPEEESSAEVAASSVPEMELPVTELPVEDAEREGRPSEPPSEQPVKQADVRPEAQPDAGVAAETSVDSRLEDIEASGAWDPTEGPYEGGPGSFVIEGGQVEHEELDEEEVEMPALAEHFDRYEEGEGEREDLDDGSGSQFGTVVREMEEERELEDEEYDFGGEEFEESEMFAGEAADEEAIEEEESEEEADEPLFAASPEQGQQRPERSDRRDRRGRRGAPPQRGGGRMRTRQQSRAVPLISELLKEGQEILVQIAKEPIGKKGARITSHIALPGRFLVYMPTVNHIGVSRKISSEEERQRLKRIVSSERENGHGGFIVRTAAANIKEDELRADIRFLKHLWTEIRTRADSSKSPALIYHDLNLVERILRDQVTSDFSQIWVDNESEYERVVRFASRFQSNLVRRIKLYTKDTPLYEQFGINEEINKSLKSKVWLKSGGYIVINQTEALVAIDVNTGKYVGKTARLEDTIVKTNIDAVKEIVRQIRLRDLGGIIVVDFIDMDERRNRQKVMQALEEAMKADRAPSKILQFNDFGLVAITRKRVKQSLERTLGTPCPYCDATGFVKSVQTVCNEIYVEMRKVRRYVEGKEVILRVNTDVAKELKSGNGRWLQEMEELLRRPVLVKSDPQLHQEQFDLNY